MLLAVPALLAAVAAYGWSGLRLAAGARTSGSPLASRSWWAGTALQGAGFALSILARTVLPLLLVQSAIAGALAVTAVLEHVAGVRALDRRTGTAVGAVTAGIAAIAAAVVPGPAHDVRPGVVALLWAIAALCAAVIPACRGAWALGAVAGSAFGVGAVAARLLVGGQHALPPEDLARFWAWPAGVWPVALLIPAGIVLGQWALTRGLARGASVAALGGDYLLATVLPSGFGLLLLGEQLRPGAWPLAVLGLACAGWGARRLLAL